MKNTCFVSALILFMQSLRCDGFSKEMLAKTSNSESPARVIASAHLQGAPPYKQEKQTEVTETRQDSLTFEKIKSSVSAAQRKEPMSKERLLLFIARTLKGIPYVGQTLEVGTKETLVVNLRRLDCTTYVENVVALYLCIKKGNCSYTSFKDYLRSIRYDNGNVTYTSRHHYFSQWIDAASREGIVAEVQLPSPPFSSPQRLDIGFMSAHSELYPRLRNNPKDIDEIRKQEKRLTGMEFVFIPKVEIKNDSLFRSIVHDGDIIAIVTTKRGLDIAHIGIAVWHDDGLHLLNASQTHKKVVEEPLLLHTYMQKHTSQSGIRVIRIN